MIEIVGSHHERKSFINAGVFWNGSDRDLYRLTVLFRGDLAVSLGL